MSTIPLSIDTAAPSEPAPAGTGRHAGGDNESIAAALREAAALLTAQGTNPFRIGAYRRAADVVAAHPESMRTLYEREGRAGLEALPSIGAGIAGAMVELLLTGRWSQLERLRGSHDPTEAFRMLPGIGPTLSQRLCLQLGAETLASLEAAAHDGRLEQIRGMGPRRTAAIRAMLDGGRGRRFAPDAPTGSPDIGVDLLLDVDREYRTRAVGGGLPTIAPRRLNPQGIAWLPVLHTRRGPWHVTALFSNTARAHELRRDHDWVVIYAYDGDHRERQHTVVTERRGPLNGRRVVRGMESACRRYYERAAERSATTDSARDPEDAVDVS